MTPRLIAPLASRLSQLADDYDREAAACRAAGGAWSQVIAAEHTRSAEQLRTVRDQLTWPATPESIAQASQWVTAAQVDLERIARA